MLTSSTEPDEVMKGQERLRQIVWSQNERIAMLVASEEAAPSAKMRRKVQRARQEAARAERQRKLEAQMAEEERKLEAQRWKGMNDAMDDVEEEIEVEDTTAAMGGIVIGQKMPWKEDLVDRTRD